jgi:hypothetical protein
MNGTGFVQGQTAVFFGPNPAPTVACSTSTQCVATAPAGFGKVSVTATVGGQAATGSATFSYIPSLSSISPGSGSPRGGTTVTIVGVGFDVRPGGTLVYFGTKAATNVSCISTTQCTAVVPAGQRNSTVSVKAVVDGTTSSNTLPYRYLKK